VKADISATGLAEFSTTLRREDNWGVCMESLTHLEEAGYREGDIVRVKMDITWLGRDAEWRVASERPADTGTERETARSAEEAS
jgi:hypothetical protein